MRGNTKASVQKQSRPKLTVSPKTPKTTGTSLRLPGRAVSPEPGGRRELRPQNLPQGLRGTARCSRPGRGVHADTGEPGAVARMRGNRRARGLRGVGRLRRGRPRGTRTTGRAGRAGRRAGHGAGRPQRAGTDLDGRLDVRPDRTPLPAGRADLDGQSERQPGHELHELRSAVGDRLLEGHLVRELSTARARGLPGVLRAGPGHDRLARVPGGGRGRSPLSRRGARALPREAPGGAARRGDRVRQARGVLAHGRHGVRRPDLLRRVPTGRHHARQERRRGLRGRGL